MVSCWSFNLRSGAQVWGIKSSPLKVQMIVLIAISFALFSSKRRFWNSREDLRRYEQRRWLHAKAAETTRQVAKDGSHSHIHGDGRPDSTASSAATKQARIDASVVNLNTILCRRHSHVGVLGLSPVALQVPTSKSLTVLFNSVVVMLSG
jgi:hypothetical protein